MVIGEGKPDQILTDLEIEAVVAKGLSSLPLRQQRVLVIVPDGTRTFPMPSLFRLLVGQLRDRGAKAITFLVALGTHPPLDEAAMLRLLGITAEERAESFPDIRVVNHGWRDPAALTTLGEIRAEEIEELSQGRLHEDVQVRLSSLVLEHDHILIAGPVFPHEVIGFSGGNKYFFPGVSGTEIIDLIHWLGALITSYHIIGRKDTPVRAVVDRATDFIPTPHSALCAVVRANGDLAGLYFGSSVEAWSAAAELSSQVHIHWKEWPFQQVLSVVPPQYEDLWTGAKGMYKVEPVVADGGEVILYAPHIREISVTHGHLIRQIGYHVLDFFLQHRGTYATIPRAVIAHSTHVRGIGTYDGGVEYPRIRVTLATQIPQETCRAVNLGYRDPNTIETNDWAGREEDGFLLVRKAGEDLYRLTSPR